MKVRHIATVGILLVAVGCAVYGWYRSVGRSNPSTCGYCSRPLHANLMVSAEIAGKRTQVCCARCAVTEANQEHKPLHLIEVHDYPSGETLSPERAWFVEGSRVKSCEHDAMRMNDMKNTEELTYDRCSPGTFAFADKPDADAFVTKNGGNIVSYAQLMGEARFQ